MDWKKMVSEFKLVTREGDRVLVDAPVESIISNFNGQDGVVTGFNEGWVFANISGSNLRFRPDELKIL